MERYNKSDVKISGNDIIIKEYQDESNYTWKKIITCHHIKGINTLDFTKQLLSKLTN